MFEQVKLKPGHLYQRVGDFNGIFFLSYYNSTCVGQIKDGVHKFQVGRIGERNFEEVELDY